MTVKALRKSVLNTWTSQSIANAFPPTAKQIKCVLGCDDRLIGLSPRSDGHAGEYFTFTDATSSVDFGIMPTARDNWATLSVKPEFSI